MVRVCERIGHVLNEQGTGYEYLKSIELKNGARHLKEHPNISKFTKFESYWLKGMIHVLKLLKNLTSRPLNLLEVRILRDCSDSEM